MAVSTLFKPKSKNLEEALAYMTETLTASAAAYEASRAKSEAEMKHIIAESHRETDAKIAESDAKIATAVAKGAEAEAGLRAVSERLEYWVGRYGDKIGALIERILIPGIKPVMNKYGHNFTTISPNREYYRSKGKRLAEIDLLLENGGEAMAIEVKTHLRKDDVVKYLAKLELLRENESITRLSGLTLLGAMAGLRVDEGARDLVLESGLYLIEMVEDTKYVNVVEPPIGVRGW
jgi:hypothetical protein